MTIFDKLDLLVMIIESRKLIRKWNATEEEERLLVKRIF